MTAVVVTLVVGVMGDQIVAEVIFTVTSIAFLVLLAHSINQLSETY